MSAAVMESVAAVCAAACAGGALAVVFMGALMHDNSGRVSMQGCAGHVLLHPTMGSVDQPYMAGSSSMTCANELKAAVPWNLTAPAGICPDSPYQCAA